MALRDWLHSLTGTSSIPHQGNPSVYEGSCHHENPWQLLKAGSTVSVDFSHHQETVHAICRIEKQKESGLRLHVVSEMGRVSLMGLKSGATGQLEVKNSVFPFQVIHVALPIVEIVLSFSRSHTSQRQLLRIPASFSVRLRHLGSTGPWTSGKGIDISAGGCCFAFPSPHMPNPGTRYDLEITLELARNEHELIAVIAEVRWGKRTNGEIQVGVEVQDSVQRRALAIAVSRLQQSISRRPTDYLLT